MTRKTEKLLARATFITILGGMFVGTAISAGLLEATLIWLGSIVLAVGVIWSSDKMV